MNNQPLISIIVPIYNVEQYLPKSIESLIGQTYQNLEIILVDDGSPDRCPQICDEYAAKDSRIRVIHKENGGLSSARNAGLNIKSGHYIMFIDSDDYIEATMAEVMVEEAEHKHADCVICQEYYDDCNSSFILSCKAYENTVHTADSMLHILAWDQCHLTCAVINKLFSSALFNEIHFEPLTIGEDVEIVPKLLAAAQRTSFISVPLYHYVQRETSVTHTEFSIKKIDYISAMISKCEFYSSLGRRKDLAKIAVTSASLLAEFYLKIENRKSSDTLNIIKTQYQAIKRHILSSDKRSLSFKDKVKIPFFCLSFKLYSALVRITL